MKSKKFNHDEKQAVLEVMQTIETLTKRNFSHLEVDSYEKLLHFLRNPKQHLTDEEEIYDVEMLERLILNMDGLDFGKKKTSYTIEEIDDYE